MVKRQSKGTRIVYSKNLNLKKYNALLLQAKLLGKVRTEVWHRYGSFNGVGINHRTIRSDWVHSRNFAPLPAKSWKETLRDAIDDIKLYEAAAKEKVRKKIYSRFQDPLSRKTYFTLLKYDKWRTSPLLCRWMRKIKKHGKNKTHNQIVVENGVYSQFTGKDGNTWLKVPSLDKGKRLCIPLNTKVKLSGMLRIILNNNQVAVHYLANGKNHKASGLNIVGIDKGYTEVFADSDGQMHGENFNKLLNHASESRMKKNKARNKLYQIAKNSKQKKYLRIIKNNLGTKKRTSNNLKIKATIRNHCFQAAHSLVDKAKVIIAEDLTSTFNRKGNVKKINRLMNAWMKNSITEALETVAKVRGSDLHYVNAAYTSQMDSKTGLLQGVRVGDKFYHTNGEVSQSDINAACNIKQRFFDNEIKRYLPFQKVKKILLDRLHASEELSNNDAA